MLTAVIPTWRPTENDTAGGQGGARGRTRRAPAGSPAPPGTGTTVESPFSTTSRAPPSRGPAWIPKAARTKNATPILAAQAPSWNGATVRRYRPGVRRTAAPCARWATSSPRAAGRETKGDEAGGEGDRDQQEQGRTDRRNPEVCDAERGKAAEERRTDHQVERHHDRKGGDDGRDVDPGAVTASRASFTRSPPRAGRNAFKPTPAT